MNSKFKPAIFAIVVGLLVYLADKSENSAIVNFVIIFITLTIISLLFPKKKKENQ